jgi:hypothetical protein
MTNFPKKPAKKKNRLGALPIEVSTTLEQPEHAPAEPTVKKARRKTGRTEPFGTRVSAEFQIEFKRLMFEDGLKKVELLEVMLAVYKAQR